MKNFILNVLIGLIVFIITLIILWYGYDSKPIEKELHLISTNNGCTRYRFYDRGNTLYYTKCEDNTQDQNI